MAIEIERAGAVGNLRQKVQFFTWKTVYGV